MIRTNRIEVGANYPETPEDMTDGEFAQYLFELTFSTGHEPKIDNRTPLEAKLGLRL